MSEIELIDCTPYEARITAKACGLRHIKATTQKDRYGLPPYGLDKCLNCPDAREARKEDVCSKAGCIEPEYNNGKCRRHNGWVPKKGFVPKRLNPTEESMAENRGQEEKSDPICKACGRVASAFKTAFNIKQGRHASCIELARQKAKREEKKRNKKTGAAATESIKEKVAEKAIGVTEGKISKGGVGSRPTTPRPEAPKGQTKSEFPVTAIDHEAVRLTQPQRVLEASEVRLPLPKACASVSLALVMLTAPERGRVLQAVKLLLDVEDAE